MAELEGDESELHALVSDLHALDKKRDATGEALFFNPATGGPLDDEDLDQFLQLGASAASSAKGSPSRHVPVDPPTDPSKALIRRFESACASPATPAPLCLHPTADGTGSAHRPTGSDASASSSGGVGTTLTAAADGASDAEHDDVMTLSPMTSAIANAMAGAMAGVVGDGCDEGEDDGPSTAVGRTGRERSRSPLGGTSAHAGQSPYSPVAQRRRTSAVPFSPAAEALLEMASSPERLAILATGGASRSGGERPRLGSGR